MLVRLAISSFCAFLASTLRAQTATDANLLVAGAGNAAAAAVAPSVTGIVSAGSNLQAVAIAVPATPTTPVTPIDPTIVVVAPADPTALVPTRSPAGETLVSLDIGFGIRFVPPSHVTVPVGENLRIGAPALGAGIQWRKNGHPITGETNPTLQLNPVQASDAGSYDAVYTDPAMGGRGSQGLVLGVGPVNRLLNLSSRVTLNAGPGQSFIAGFIVSATTSTPKKLIIRAVGPTLASFGVTNPLKKPALRIYDGAGKPYQNGYVYSAVAGGLTYDTDLANSLARAGAFPIPVGSDDAVVMMPFLPGSYTAEVTSGDLTGGAVLLEIYEVP